MAETGSAAEAESRPSAKIFIAFSAEDGDAVATALQQLLQDVLGLEDDHVFVATKITSGAAWRESLTQGLDTAEFSILCLTRGALKSNWVPFEAGYSMASMKSRRGTSSKSVGVCPFLVDVSPKDLDSTLYGQQQAKEANEEDTLALCLDIGRVIGKGEDGVRRRFGQSWGKLEAAVSAVRMAQPSAFSRVCQSIGELGENPSSAIQGNGLFEAACATWARDLKRQLAGRRQSLTIPAERYPHYVLELLSRYPGNVAMGGVALVDEYETFWTENMGRQLAKAMPANGSRVFVFRTRRSMMRHVSMLQEHAGLYNVFALSFERLVRDLPRHAHDFSVISKLDDNEGVTAYYDQLSDRGLVFDSSAHIVAERRAMLIKIREIAHPIETEHFDADEVIQRVFTDLTLLERKPVEMSSYISIEDYDQHELDHAYFPEMMDKMVQVIREHSREDGKPIRILELGAGTGHFTRRLLEIPNSEVQAVEIDWACYKRLLHNLDSIEGASGRYKVYCEDSRTYDPEGPEGKFDFVVSSFADHHIKLGDKPQYFENVLNNLEPDALFVVGDEFLRDHDKDDFDEWESALRDYHNHIIGVARSEGHEVLAGLEEEALKSGLARIGDFKTSIRQYRETAALSKLYVQDSWRIGPDKATSQKVGSIEVIALGQRP